MNGYQGYGSYGQPPYNGQSFGGVGYSGVPYGQTQQMPQEAYSHHVDQMPQTSQMHDAYQLPQTHQTHQTHDAYSLHYGIKPSSYCMECGAVLHPSMSFCMECGTRAGSVSTTSDHSLLNSATNQSAYYPQPFMDGPQGQSGNLGGVLIMGILLMVAAIILLVGVLLFTQGNNEESASEQTPPALDAENQEQEQEDYSYDDEPVDLDETYTTDSDTPRASAYPVFRFDYPSDWFVVDGELSESYELVSAESGAGEEIDYVLIDDSASNPYTVRVGNMEKVADCGLKFSGRSDIDASSSVGESEKFAVVKFTIRKSDSPLLNANAAVLAVLPEYVIDDPSKIDFTTGLPSFKRGYNISFFMIYDKDTILERRLDEAIAILSSLSYVKEVPASDAATLRQNASVFSSSDYIIPYSDTVLLTQSDLAGLSEYELYLARNEIYARYGRKFVNVDLNTYFNSKDWYTPLIEPQDFNDSMLTQVEKDNLQTILNEERRIGSEYI